MKKIWKNLWSNIYFKISLFACLIIIVGLVFYRLFITNIVIFNQNENIFLTGVKAYFEYEPLNLPREGGYREVSLKNMYDLGWVKTLKVPNTDKLCSEKSYVRVINEGGKYRYITYLKCGDFESDVDHDAPEIVLNGSNTVISNLNQEYIDLGVKEVRDNKNKIDLSKVVINTSGVDTNKVGTYEVKYEVYDNNYNVARTTRKVVVAETIKARITREKGNNYRYVGDAVDNYILFSGMLFRIVKMDENNIMLITDNTIANLSYGTMEQEYKDSNVYKWLNNYFLANISKNSQKYMVDTTWCYDNMAIGEAEVCNNKLDAKVGMLGLKDYEYSLVDNRSYLVQYSRFMLLNKESDLIITVSDIYNDNALTTMHISDLVGVRPVIMIKGDTYLTSGSGIITDPFKLQDYTYAKENDKLNSRLVGEYVSYSGNYFRIAGFDEEGNTKLVGVDLLRTSGSNSLYAAGYDLDIESVTPDVNNKGNLYNGIKEDAINYLSDASIVSHEYTIPIYENSRGYNEWKSTKIKSMVSIPASFEMFAGYNNMATSNQVYWLSDYSEDNLVTILNGVNGIAFRIGVNNFPRNNVKPVIYVKNNLKIASGKGTYANPYYVR